MYDVQGRLLRSLIDRNYTAGRWSVDWDHRDQSNRQVGNGVYFYRMTAGGFSEQRKMMIIH